MTLPLPDLLSSFLPPPLVLLFFFLLLDLAKIAAHGSPSSYFSLLFLPSSSLFFRSSSVVSKLAYLPLRLKIFSSPSPPILFITSSVDTYYLPLVLRSQPLVSFHLPPLCHLSLSPPQSLLSAKESELQECQGRLTQLEEQLRAAQTGADRATIVKMKQVSF